MQEASAQRKNPSISLLAATILKTWQLISPRYSQSDGSMDGSAGDLSSPRHIRTGGLRTISRGTVHDGGPSGLRLDSGRWYGLAPCLIRDKEVLRQWHSLDRPRK